MDSDIFFQGHFAIWYILLECDSVRKADINRIVGDHLCYVMRR